MGLGGSTLMGQKADKSSERARVTKELSDKILTLFFSKADFRDILSLSSITACPKYVFTTAEALGSLFQSIQVYPTLGKKGEILFAPIQTLSPGLVKQEGSKELLEATKIRDQRCMDVAYYYVRIFQIYGALALTVLDTDPVRKRLSALRRPSGQMGPQRGIFTGGAIPMTRGEIGKQMAASSFAPFIPFFSVKDGLLLRLDDKTGPGEFFIRWSPPEGPDNHTVKGYYRRPGSAVKEVDVKMEKSIDDSEIDMYIDGKEFQKFKKDLGTWIFYNDELDQSQDPKEFIKAIHDYFAGRNVKRGAKPSSMTGKSSFENFEQIKKLYENRFEGKDFPKSYCVARAMTLLSPIFESERYDKSQPYYTQICAKTLDFETTDYMPRAGKTPGANVYLRSLTSLYYDSYEIKGGQVTFVQSEQSKQELRDGSAQIAKLYNITTSPETFLESNSPFKAFSTCGTDSLQRVDDMVRRDLLTNVINPMLRFQENHTDLVNKMLKRMFTVSTDPKEGVKMTFSKELTSGGIASVNAFGREASRLLLDYYKKSEAYYINGVILLEKNKKR